MKKLMLTVFLLTGFGAFAEEFLVKYRSPAAIQLLNQISAVKKNQISVLDRHDVGQLVLVDIGKTREIQILAQLFSDPSVEYVVPNFKLYAVENRPMDMAALKDQWAIAKVQAEKAWARAGNKGSRNIVVAVIDTGVDSKHVNLSPNMIQGYDFKDNDNDPSDVTSQKNPGHGTHCAGIVGATGLIDGGIVGLSPEVSMMPLRFLGSDGSGDLNAAIKAIDYAIEKGAHVISASWGAAVARATAAPLIEAIKRADDKGVIFVAAAANDGANNDTTEMYPANSGYPNTITVAASGDKDEKPSWSNFGRANVHVASPGLNIMSTLPTGKYGNLSGTSMATPLVAGLVAFLKAQDPGLTGAQVRALLQTTGAKVEIETACKCRVDAFQAVDNLLNKKMLVVPSAATLAPSETMNLSVMNGSSPFKYVSSNSSSISVSDSGVVTASGLGSALITVTDSKGNSVTTLDFHVAAKDSGGGGGSCPLGNPLYCQILCGIFPTLPFCSR